MGILDFANELLLIVGENLSIGDISRFCSTAQRLHLVLTPYYEMLCLEDVGKLTALQWAVLRGHVELIELQILNGADIDKPLGSKMSDTPRSIFPLVKQAYLDHLHAIYFTPPYLAACSRKVRAIVGLLTAGASMKCVTGINTLAHVAAKKGDVDCMWAYISAGFDINTRGGGGCTILHKALFGVIKMVKYLLEHAGGERLVNSKDSLMQTPLH